MKARIQNITVNGKQYKVWGDFIQRAMYAEDENGETKRIHGSGYLSNELSIRKAVATSFNLSTFRK